jgi:hypothetical protein
MRPPQIAAGFYGGITLRAVETRVLTAADSEPVIGFWPSAIVFDNAWSTGTA